VFPVNYATNTEWFVQTTGVESLSLDFGVRFHHLPQSWIDGPLGFRAGAFNPAQAVSLIEPLVKVCACRP
jgi:hypothetical protein